jgi:hypothetical protein
MEVKNKIFELKAKELDVSIEEVKLMSKEDKENKNKEIMDACAR